MSFLSCTFDGGVFALKLDLSFFRRRESDEDDEPEPVPMRASAPRKKLLKNRGARPLPPPFPLPPVKLAIPVELLLHAPTLLAATPPPRNPTPLPNVIIDRSITEVGAQSPDRTLQGDDDDDEESPLHNNKTDLVRQRRDVRKALRKVAR